MVMNYGCKIFYDIEPRLGIYKASYDLNYD
jgi:hypothetical protein